jgi:predicted enzyme involved in methoxymalonyl-ACP biosynthesis
MLDEFVRACKQRGVTTIRGYYYPTAKNAMVRDFYDKQGFKLDGEDESGNKSYSLDISGAWDNQNQYITIKRSNSYDQRSYL